MPIDNISPAKCYLPDDGGITVYRDDGSWQETKGSRTIAEAFPDLADLPKCTLPSSAEITLQSSD